MHTKPDLVAGTEHEWKLFTEDEYGSLLDLAKQKYTFGGFDQELDRPLVVWRHDVDYSPHRALALAEMEAKRGLRCIYHVQLASRYYNVFEPEIAKIFRRIAKLGHEIGLHFDMDVFSEDGEVSAEGLDSRITFERDTVAMLVGARLPSMSFHNYVLNRERLHMRDTICGMINASAPTRTERYRYVSDSNGIWRYDQLRTVLSESAVPRLHVLTHPEWWTPEPMSPVQRLRRLIAGRADANFQIYLHQMYRDGRLAAIGKRIGLDDRLAVGPNP